MKCDNCGFVSNKEFYRCPYCGKVHESTENLFRRSFTLGNLFTIRLQTLIYIIVANIFGVALLVDWYFGFSYGIVLWAFIILFSIVLSVSIFGGKKNIISIYEKVIFYFMFCLILACGTCYIKGVFDFRPYVISFAIPLFVILSAIGSLFLLFVRKHSKIRPLWTEVLIIAQLSLMSVIFALFLVNKYCIINGVEHVPFQWFQLGKGLDMVNTPLYKFEELLIYFAFGVAVLYFFNFNIILIGHIFRQVKSFYGKGSRD